MASRDNPWPDTNPMSRPEYWTQERIAGIQESLDKHAKSEDSYDILGWRADNDLTLDNVMTMCGKSPMFRRAYENAKAKIGSRRQKNALTNQWHAGTVHRDDWAYTPETLAYQREMKDKEAAANQIPAQLAAQAKIEDQAKQIEQLNKKLAELST